MLGKRKYKESSQLPLQVQDGEGDQHLQNDQPSKRH